MKHSARSIIHTHNGVEYNWTSNSPKNEPPLLTRFVNTIEIQNDVRRNRWRAIFAKRNSSFASAAGDEVLFDVSEEVKHLKSLYAPGEIEVIKEMLENKADTMKILTNCSKRIVSILRRMLAILAEVYLNQQWLQSIEVHLSAMEMCFVCVLLKFLASDNTVQKVMSFLEEREDRELKAFNKCVENLDDDNDDSEALIQSYTSTSPIRSPHKSFKFSSGSSSISLQSISNSKKVV